TVFDRGGSRRDPHRRPDTPTVPNTTVTPQPYPRPFPLDVMIGFLVYDLSAPDVTVAVLNTQGQVVSSTIAFSSASARTLPALPAGWIQQVTDQPTTGTGPPTAQWIVPAEGGGRELVVVQAL